MTNQVILLSAKMIEARDQLRRVSGDSYETRVAPVRDLLRGIAKNSGQTILSVGQEAAKTAQDSGEDMAAWGIIAATVDCLETPEGPCE